MPSGTCRFMQAGSMPVASPGSRLRVWLLALVFLVQLFAVSLHHHQVGVNADDCPSCLLAGQIATGSTPTLPSVPQSWLIFLRVVVPQSPISSVIRTADFLFPLPLAPPF